MRAGAISLRFLLIRATRISSIRIDPDQFWCAENGPAACEVATLRRDDTNIPANRPVYTRVVAHCMRNWASLTIVGRSFGTGKPLVTTRRRVVRHPFRKTAMQRILWPMFAAMALITGVAANAQTPKPTRTVQANALTSERDPSVRIELPKSVQYVGAERWVL